MASLPQKRGDGAPGDATVLRFARLLAKAWRPPAHRPAFSFGAGPRFPDGLTVFDTAGQWRDAKTKAKLDDALEKLGL